MYWLISQFPELDHLEPRQRAQVLAHVPWWTYPVMVGRAALSALFIGAITAGLLAAGFGTDAAAFGAVPVAGAIAVFFYRYQLARLRTAMRRTILEALRGERLPFCFQCGYNLRDSIADRCPECGSPAHGATRASRTARSRSFRADDG